MKSLQVFVSVLVLHFSLISAVTEALMAPAQYPGCSGTRNLRDNLSDLRAQVAANQRGCQLVGELIDSYGLEVVQAYMGYIQVCTFCLLFTASLRLLLINASAVWM